MTERGDALRQARERAQSARSMGHRAVTEGVNLRYVERLRQELYALSDAHDALADALTRERDEAREALAAIEETARWYADNGDRLPHEVDHALCVEVLSSAADALAAVEADTETPGETP